MDTVKVKMNVSIASADWSFVPEQVVELDTTLADAWVEVGHALEIKGEKVDKTKLVDGVEYMGFGIFSAHGQRVVGKKEANEAYKEIPQEVQEAYRLAKEEEAAKLAAEAEAGEDVDSTGDNTANGGADNAAGSEGTPQG